MFLRALCVAALMVNSSFAFAAKDELLGIAVPHSSEPSSKNSHEEVITLGIQIERRVNVCENEIDARSVIEGYCTYNASIKAFQVLINAGKCYRKETGLFTPQRIVTSGMLSGVKTTILEATAPDGSVKYYIVSGRIVDPSVAQ